MTRMHRRFSLQGQGTQKRVAIHKRNDSDSKVIRGYGAVFYNPDDAGTEYWLWDDMVERIMPGAFDRVLNEAQDVRCLFNHDMNYVLGRTASGTCRLAVDAIGLYYESDESPTDPQWQSVASKLARGDVSGSSFSFWPRTTVWETTKVDERSIDIRWIKEMEIVYDVGPVTFPAYEAASSSRSIQSPERELLLRDRNAFQRSRDEVSMRMREVSYE
jgi:uncharacterized protein